MNIHTLGTRTLGLAAAATFTVSLAATGSATAAQPAASASVAGDTLTVIGTGSADHLALRLAGTDPNTLQVDFGDDGTADESFDRTTFSQIAVFLGGGDDQVRVDRSGGSLADEALVIDAGAGDDSIIGGDGDELIFGGGGRDTVTPNRGNDTAILGGGDDTFTWNPGDGSDSVDGGANSDTMVFNGSNASETMSLSANGTRALLLRNVANIRMDMNDVENLDLATLGGADLVTIDDTTGTGFQQANINLAATQGSGDGSQDVVTVNGTTGADRIRVDADGSDIDVRGLATKTRGTGGEPTDPLHVNGNNGDDSANIGSGVSPLIGVRVDLGSAQL